MDQPKTWVGLDIEKLICGKNWPHVKKWHWINWNPIILFHTVQGKMTFDNTKQLEQNNVVANIGRDNTSTLVGIFLNIMNLLCIQLLWIACVARVSVWFRSKEIPRKGTFNFDCVRNETTAKKWKRGKGKGKEGNACRQTPRFWKPAFASERSAWLAWLVEQCWHVSIKGLFHTERSRLVRDTHINFLWYCLFWSARFSLQCKSILFNFFWNTKLFLRLYKGFRSFYLSPGSE